MLIRFRYIIFIEIIICHSFLKMHYTGTLKYIVYVVLCSSLSVSIAFLQRTQYLHAQILVNVRITLIMSRCGCSRASYSSFCVQFERTHYLQNQLIIIIIITLYCPKLHGNVGNLICANGTRQPQCSASSSVVLSFTMLSAKVGSNNSHLLSSFGMTRPGIEPRTPG